MENGINTKKCPVLIKKRKGHKLIQSTTQVMLYVEYVNVKECLDTVIPEKYIISNFNKTIVSEDNQLTFTRSKSTFFIFLTQHFSYFSPFSNISIVDLKHLTG